MKPELCKEAFIDRLRQGGLELSSLSPTDGITAMLDFYASERAEGCPLETDSDMLLYQYGTYGGYGGEAKSFEFDITRQFIMGEGEDDDIWQLSLTYKFAPSEPLEEAGSKSLWCDSPAGLPGFREFIVSSPAYAAVRETSGAKATLEYGSAG